MLTISLSIIIPAKNEQRLIGSCIDSVKASIEIWGKNAEIIVVDNGSADDTICISIKKGCHVINCPGGTISQLRNKGARYSKGAVLAFLDADCLVSPYWIEYCLQNFENNKVVAVGTRAIPDANNSTWVEKGWLKLMPGSPRPDFVDWLGTSNLFIDRDVFFEAGQFNEKLKTAEDVDLCYRIRKKYNIKLEKRIDTIHLRESKTLYQLYKREYWRGSNSIASLAQSKQFHKEFLSVAVPIVNIISIILFFIPNNYINTMSGYAFSVVVTLPIILMLRKRVHINKVSLFFQIYIIAFTYIFARSISIIGEIVHMLLTKIKYDQ